MPETVTVAPITLAPGVGEVIVSGSEPGIPLVTYRRVTIAVYRRRGRR